MFTKSPAPPLLGADLSSEQTARLPIPGLPPAPIVLGRVERFFIRPIIYSVKAGALAFSAVIWLLFGPVWFAMLFRTMTSFSMATVRSLFSSSTIPDPARLEYIAAFWMRGFGILFNAILYGASANEITRPDREFFDPLTEMALALLFYTYVVVSLYYLQHWLPIVASVFGFGWWLVSTAIGFVFSGIPILYHRAFG